MKYLFAFAFALVFVAGCGGGDYKAPPRGNELEPAPNRTQQPDVPERTPTGPSMHKEYEREMNAAFDAHKEYESVKRDAEARKEPYIVWAEHLYAALAYANIHERNGHSKGNLPRFTELRELRSGYFKNSLGPSDDPRVKAAMRNWQESTN